MLNPHATTIAQDARQTALTHAHVAEERLIVNDMKTDIEGPQQESFFISITFILHPGPL